MPCSIWNFPNQLTGDQTMPSAVEAQTLNCWTKGTPPKQIFSSTLPRRGQQGKRGGDFQGPHRHQWHWQGKTQGLSASHSPTLPPPPKSSHPCQSHHEGPLRQEEGHGPWGRSNTRPFLSSPEKNLSISQAPAVCGKSPLLPFPSPRQLHSAAHALWSATGSLWKREKLTH